MVFLSPGYCLRRCGEQQASKSEVVKLEYTTIRAATYYPTGTMQALVKVWRCLKRRHCSLESERCTCHRTAAAI